MAVVQLMGRIFYYLVGDTFVVAKDVNPSATDLRSFYSRSPRKFSEAIA